MRVSLSIATAALAVLLILVVSGCAGVPAAKLSEPVRGNLVTFPVSNIAGDLPRPVTVPLSEYQAVVVGEFHDVGEQDDVLAALIRGLATRGFRLVLVEGFSAMNWAIDRYVLGEAAWPSAQNDAERYYLGLVRTDYGALMDEIRDLNSDLSADDRIRMAAVDMNHSMNVFPFMLRLYSRDGYFPRIDPVERFLSEADFRRPGTYAEELDRLARDLQNAPDHYRGVLGGGSYGRLLDLVELEQASFRIRQTGSYSGRRYTRLREELIKETCDRYLAATSGKTLMNFGIFHIQKTGRLGTVREWIGEYLHSESPYTRGNACSLAVVPARIVRPDGFETFVLADRSPARELLRMTSELAGGSVGFLSLRDPFFARERVRLNVNNRLLSVPPARLFDAVMVLPQATYDRQE